MYSEHHGIYFYSGFQRQATKPVGFTRRKTLEKFPRLRRNQNCNKASFGIKRSNWKKMFPAGRYSIHTADQALVLKCIQGTKLTQSSAHHLPWTKVHFSALEISG